MTLTSVKSALASNIIAIRRRDFLFGGGGFALGALLLDGCGRGGGDGAQTIQQGERFGAYIQVTDEGDVVVITPGAEMGQGVASSLPKIVAEEMDADWERVRIELSGGDPAFNNPAGRQRSANSDAVSSYYHLLRQVGARARGMLVAAAAARWRVDPSAVLVNKGVLTNTQSKAVLQFSDVASFAAQFPIPENPVLKDPADFNLIGTYSPRKDIPDKVLGKAIFGMDLVLPEMLYAAIKHTPIAGAELDVRADMSARSMPGVNKVVRLKNAVAVLANTYWQAQQACDTIEIAAERDPSLTTEVLRKEIRKALTNDAQALPFPIGESAGEMIESIPLDTVEEALSSSARVIDFEYETSYLAHASMEPLCATALIKDDRCEIWAPTQAGDAVIREAAALLDVPEQSVTLNRTYLGGGFGRKNERDFILEAIEIARAAPGRPVMLIYSRLEDIRNDYYRPAYSAHTRCGLSEDGEITVMHSRIAGQALLTAKLYRTPGRADASVASGLISSIYNMPQKRIDYVEIDKPIRTGFWRSVAGSHNGFFSEAMIDDIAAEIGRDPLDLRLELAKDDRRSIKVLEKAAAEADWGVELGPGRGRGVSLATGWNSRCAQIIEVSVEARKLTIGRVVCAFDCGVQIDPDNIAAQIEGGIIFGLSAALFGQINFKDGEVIEQNFSDYPVLTLINSPRIDVHLIKSAGIIGGVGEAGVPGAAPALSSAVFDATGARPRRLPLVASGWEIGR